MAAIVCALRGGPDSRLTIQRAIALAREHNLPVVFLYVVNLDFLTHTSRSRVDTLTSEMEQMGEFILLAAQTEAEAQGVQASRSVRHGRVGDEIISLCREREGKYVVIGRPQGLTEDDVFTQAQIEGFRQRVEQESQAQVVVAGEEG